MAFSKGLSAGREESKFRIDMSPMIDCVFQLLIFFIVTLQMDPSLDDVLQLPDAFKSKRQEELNMEIYILPAGIGVERTGEKYYIENWLTEDGLLNASETVDYSGLIAFAAKGDYEDMFVRLDDVPYMIDLERKKKSKDLFRALNVQRAQRKLPPFNKQQEDSVKANMALLIKADKDVFYGRVLQVVEKAKEANVFNFSFVTSVQSSQEMERNRRKEEAGNAK